jgi:hypothetical protein
MIINTFEFKKVTNYFTFSAILFLFFSATAQVQQNGNLFIGDNASMRVIGTYNFGTTSGATSQTTSNANYGRLYFGFNSFALGQVAAHHLNGYVTTVNSSDFTFPIGNGIIYAPLRVQSSNTTKEIDAAYKASAPTGTVDGVTLSDISDVEYWDVPNSSDASAKITLSWRSTSNLSSLSILGGGTVNVSHIVIAGYNNSSSKWELIESTVDTNNYFDTTASTLTAGSITSNSAVSFGTYTKFALATKGDCSFAAVTPSGVTCTWTSSWSPNAPTISDRAVIDVTATTSPGTFKCYDLTLNANIELTAGQSIEIVTGLTATSIKKITMASSASVLQRQAGTPPLVAITKDNTVKANDYVHFGLPVNAPNTSIATGFNTFLDGTNTAANAFTKHYQYVTGATGFGWQEITNTPAQLGRGFISYVPNVAPYAAADTAIDIKIEGTANNGDISINTMANNPSSINGGSSYPLLANPYPSGLDAIKFLEQNTGLDGTVYVWTSYSQYSGVGNNGSADYIAFNKAGTIGLPSGSGLSFNGIISSAQGFRARILDVGSVQQTPTITFNNCMRTTESHLFYRYSQQNENSNRDRFKLNLTGTNQVFSQILVGYFPETTLGYDRMYDAMLNSSSTVRLYSFMEPSSTNTKLSINARPTFLNTDVVALGISKSNTTLESLSIAMADKEGVFAENTVNVYLHDLALDVYHNLGNGPYSFTSNATQLNDRFQVVYQNPTLDNPSFESTKAVAFINNGTLTVTATIGITSIEIYDIAGRNIASIKGLGLTSNTSPFVYSEGVYIAKIKLENGTITTQKLITQD